MSIAKSETLLISIRVPKEPVDEAIAKVRAGVKAKRIAFYDEITFSVERELFRDGILL
jgi:hypothetical protein